MREALLSLAQHPINSRPPLRGSGPVTANKKARRSRPPFVRAVPPDLVSKYASGVGVGGGGIGLAISVVIEVLAIPTAPPGYLGREREAKIGKLTHSPHSRQFPRSSSTAALALPA